MNLKLIWIYCKILKAAYPTISDSTLQSLNIILTGFNATQLSSLTISSDNTISVLGAINTWSSAQVFEFKN